MAVTSTQTIVIGGRVHAPMTMSRHLMARGAVAVIVGLLALLWPSAWIFTVTVVLGLAALAVGIAELVDGALRRRLGEDWVFEVVRGLLTLGLGLYLVAWPNLPLDLLAMVVGLVWLLYGGAEAIEGLRRRRGGREGRWRTVRGVVIGVLGLTVLVWPSITVTVLVRLIGGLLVVSGLLCFISARALCHAGHHQRDVRLDIVS